MPNYPGRPPPFIQRDTGISDKNKILPDEKVINAWPQEVAAEKLQPCQDQSSNQSLLSNEPVAGKVINKQKDGALQITTLTLNNGIKVMLKPTNFKNEAILFTAVAPGGTSLYPDTDYQLIKKIPLGGAGDF
jgi:zinc protease